MQQELDEEGQMRRDAPALTSRVVLALCGDVMTGRGIDQALPHPGDPTIYESFVRSATVYVALAERVNGPIPRPVDPAYIWGDALPQLEREAPDALLINLETAVTTSDAPWPDKGITYRMHPANLSCLTVARVDCCVLANNHVLDWGREGLRETLRSVQEAGMRTVGAGLNCVEAAAPVAFAWPGRGRVLLWAWGLPSSGIPFSWAATAEQAGVNLLEDLSPRSLARVAEHIRAARQPGDRVAVSLHWGGNWGYAVPAEHRDFARQLITVAGVDLVYGHSSHHPLGIEVYRERLILYGCGDLINDYEGIGGYEEYRPDLGIIILATLDADGRLVETRLLPFRRRRFRLWRATAEEAGWLARRLSRVSRKGGVVVALRPDETLEVRW
ncbi:MAG: CapA family protein [Oscillochloridaceae bacterium]|nr:CapA family protein [Chloroflexaceae bacterium]MDW8388820.1 CapA family protein [Oscillochloridaceae bacterium]